MGSKELAWFRALPSGHLWHPWLPERPLAACLIFGAIVGRVAVPMYASLYAVGAVLRAAKGQRPGVALRNLARNTLWSTAFLSAYGGSLVGIVTLLSRLHGRNSRAHPAVAGFLASWSILLERKDRRGDLGLYVAFQGLWCLWRKLAMTGRVTPVRNGEVLLFAGALAGMAAARASTEARRRAAGQAPPPPGALGFLLGRRPRGKVAARRNDAATGPTAARPPSLQQRLVAGARATVRPVLHRINSHLADNAVAAKLAASGPLAGLFCRRMLLGWALKCVRVILTARRRFSARTLRQLVAPSSFTLGATLACMAVGSRATHQLCESRSLGPVASEAAAGFVGGLAFYFTRCVRVYSA